MFRETMRAAIEGARTLAQMDELSRQVWQAHASGAWTMRAHRASLSGFTSAGAASGPGSCPWAFLRAV